jgi:hypothetical protein
MNQNWDCKGSPQPNSNTPDRYASISQDHQEEAVLKYNDSGILHLPTEILVLIFTYLPKLSDAVCFAATSRYIRLIFNEYANSIYDPLASRTFSFHKHARQLLVDEGGPKFGEKMTLPNIAIMFRNWKIVEAAMAEFELQMSKDVTSKWSLLRYAWVA